MRWLLVASLFACAACRDTDGLKGVKDKADGGPVVADLDGGTTEGDDDGPPRDPIVREERPNPIPAENARPGDPGWQSGSRTHYTGQVEVYASLDSAKAGDEVAVKVSTDVPTEVRLEVYRLGWYGGAGARKVWSGGPFPASKQPDCPADPSTGLVECAWSDTATFTVGQDWVSGLYVIKVLRPKGGTYFKRFAPLVVRDSRKAEILFQPGFHTYQAYNAWGGQSLYTATLPSLKKGRAYEVSYDRPYADNDGSGQMLTWEYPFARLLEEKGYDVTYATNHDFERYEGLLDGIGAFLHGGHDEYWSTRERQVVDKALSDGQMSLVHLGGNGAYWRVRMLPSSSGKPLRRLVCYKASMELDPRPGSTVRFRDDPQAHPENALFGAYYDGWMLSPFPLIVSDPDHWLFEGTGLRRGAQLHGLVGFEFDKVAGNGTTPPGLRVPMDSPVLTAEGVPSRAHVVERTLPSGRLVFSAGTIYWPLALSDDPELRDARVIRMTLNVIQRALAHRRTPQPLEPVTGPVPTQPEPIGAWVSRVEPLAGVPGAGGYRDGPAAQALFLGPTGVAVLPSGEVAVADTGNNRIRLVGVDPERTVHTIAGNGQLGDKNGPGAQASFRWPTSVAAGPDGSLYVADSDNHVIRRLEKTASGWEVTTYAGVMRQMGSTDGPALQARFRRPTALTIDAQGNLYVADQAGNRIRRVLAGSREVETLAGSGRTAYEDHAEGAKAAFNNPSALALGPGGALYVFDTTQHLRRVSLTPPYAVTTLAGRKERALGFADGPGDAARFRAQLGMAVDANGLVILADTANYRIREVSPGANAAGTSVRTIAGSGLMGTKLGPGDESDIVAPAGLALVPGTSSLVVSDTGNNVLRLIVR